MGLLFSARMEDGIVTAAAPPETPPCAEARSGDLGVEINGFVNTGDDGNSTNRDSPENNAIDRKNSPDGEEKIESEEPSVKKVRFSEDTAVEEDAERKVVELQNGKLSGNKSSKKSKKKSKDIWSSTSKKSRKKNKTSANSNHNSNGNADDDKVLITPIAKFPDKSDDCAEMTICLSKAYKAEKIELSEDRLTASSTKGYRMVRATRGVKEGAWYFEIKVVHLGESGHTRLGWSTQKGDLQAPVGYDGNSYGYRDVDGSKVHKSLRVNYAGEGYKEGDVIGFYINLPNGAPYAPDPPRFVWYKGQRYACASDEKDDPPEVVPGSEILFFKNGVSQGVAFEDLHGGLYYPAASMYTLPKQPNCVVKFNFGPDFEAFPVDFNGHPQPRPMFEVPYQGYQAPIKNGNPWNNINCSKE